MPGALSIAKPERSVSLPHQKAKVLVEANCTFNDLQSEPTYDVNGMVSKVRHEENAPIQWDLHREKRGRTSQDTVSEK